MASRALSSHSSPTPLALVSPRSTEQFLLAILAERVNAMQCLRLLRSRFLVTGFVQRRRVVLTRRNPAEFAVGAGENGDKVRALSFSRMVSLSMTATSVQISLQTVTAAIPVSVGPTEVHVTDWELSGIVRAAAQKVSREEFSA
jgi:hypothetical protein